MAVLYHVFSDAYSLCNSKKPVATGFLLFYNVCVYNSERARGYEFYHTQICVVFRCGGSRSIYTAQEDPKALVVIGLLDFLYVCRSCICVTSFVIMGKTKVTNFLRLLAFGIEQLTLLPS